MLYQVAVPIIQPRMRFFDADGKPLVGGKVYSFKVGTELFKPTYRDAQKTALNTNPIILDSDGSALIYLTGAHVLKVYDKNGNFIEERYLPETQMKTQFFDKLGVPLKNGKVWTYDIASTIKKTSYANADKNQLNANPVVLDAEGWASISMIGSYRLRSYNEKGVSTGDQDFKRPAAKALTSRVYPLYFEEGVLNGCELKNSGFFQAPLLSESIGTPFSVAFASVRNVMNSYNSDPELVFAGYSLIGVVRVETRSIYQNTTPPIENISSLATLISAQITRQIGYVTNIMQPENISSNYSVLAAQITN